MQHTNPNAYYYSKNCIPKAKHKLCRNRIFFLEMKKALMKCYAISVLIQKSKYWTISQGIKKRLETKVGCCEYQRINTWTTVNFMKNGNTKKKIICIIRSKYLQISPAHTEEKVFRKIDSHKTYPRQGELRTTAHNLHNEFMHIVGRKVISRDY